jgi:hypothetical protein
MAEQKVLKTAFNAGELSPLFEGRVDHVKYSQGLSKSRNMIPTVHGAITRRPGTKLVAQLKTDIEINVRRNAPVLIPHEISADRAYLYELAPNTSTLQHVLKNRARRSTQFDFGRQITEPLRRADFSSSVATAQSGETLYMTDDGTHPLYAITNTETSPGLESIVCGNAFPATPTVNGLVTEDHPTPFVQNYLTPPFQDYRPELNRIISVEGTSTVGEIDINGILWAPVGTFTGKKGHRIVFNPDLQELIDVSKWVLDMTVNDQKILYHQGRFYNVLLNGGETSVQLKTEPLHEYGAIYSSVAGRNAQLGYIGNGHFSGTIWSNPETDPDRPGLENALIRWDHTNAPKCKTARWAWAAIGTSATLETGAAYPDNVTIFRNRLVLSAGGKLYFSRAGRLLDFNQYDGSGQVVADSAITVEIPSKQKISVEWLASKETMVIGSKVGIFECIEETLTEPFGPGNIKIQMVSTSGSASVNPILIDSDIFYVLRGGKRLHRLAQSGGGWVSLDVSVISDHLGKYGFTELAWQNEPWKVLWTVTGDGRLVGMTWNREQDVWAWHPHESGDAEFRGVACIPSPDGTIDDVWLATARFSSQNLYISRSRTGFIELMADAHKVDGDLREAVYCDLSESFAGDGGAGGPIGYEMLVTGGTLWDSSELLTITRNGLVISAPPATFAASNVGMVLRALQTEVGPAFNRIPKEGGAYVDFEIVEFVSAIQIKVRPRSPVPASLRNFAAWQFRRDFVVADHLAGRTVDVLADGSAHPQVVADSAGKIRLQAHFNRVTVGLPCVAIAKPMRIEGGAEQGTSQGQTKRITHVITRLHESVGIKVGASEDRTQEETFRKQSDEMDGPVPAFNGDLRVPFKGGNTSDGYVVMMNDQPLPLTVISIVAEMAMGS